MGMISEIFADVANKGMPVMSVDAMQTLPIGILPMLDSTDMIVTADDLAKMAEDMEKNPPLTNLPVMTPDEQAKIDQLGTFFTDVLNGNATAHIFENVDGNRDVCAVSADNPYEVRTLGGRPLEIIPGGNLDWNALTYLHENAHCEDFKEGGYDKSDINPELYGDFKGFQDYYKGYRNGVVTDPEVPYAWRAQRAIDVMEQGNYGADGPQGHSVNAIAPLPGEKYAGAQHTSNHAAGMAMLQARDDIHAQIGKDLYDLPDFNRLQIVNGMINNGMEMDPSLRQEVFRATAIPSFDATADAALVEKVTAQMTPEQKKFFEDSAGAWEKVGRDNAAQQAIQDQPGLLYETSKRMLQTGEFDNNPAGKQFVENYVDGVERYDPTRHGVAPEDRPTGRPEIVDQLAHQYAPRAEPVLQNGYAR